MARIRTIKPEFWQDEKLASLPPLTRLVFLGLISQADDAGRLLDNLKMIDAFVFPMSEETSRDSLGILARFGRIIRYTAPSGQRLIQIVNWGKHQKVDNPNKYVLPGPTTEDVAAQPTGESSREPRENLAREARNPIVTTNDQRPTTNDLTDVVELHSTPPAVPSLALVPRAEVRPSRQPVGLAAIQDRIAATIAGMQAKGATRERQADIRRVQADVVFSYWVTQTNHPKALLDSKRENKILGRLKESGGDVSELLYAIDGLCRSPFHMGQDPKTNGQRYDGIDVVFRDREQVETLAGKVAAYRAGTPHPVAVEYLGGGTEEATA